MWDSLIQVNLRGGYVVAQKAARHMIQAGGGAIVNVSSILALVADPSLIIYSATKGGVSGITRALAIRLAEHNIRVNAVCPADVATPLLDEWIDRQPDPAQTRPPLLRPIHLATTVTRRTLPAAFFSWPGRMPAVSPGPKSWWTAV